MNKQGVAEKKKKKKVVHGDTPFLPEELITNILKRLPVKSLIRSQCVCKQWENLVKSPSFIADHLQCTSYPNPSLLFHRRLGPFDPLNLLVFDSELRVLDVHKTLSMSNMYYPEIIGSCNCLICVQYLSYDCSSTWDDRDSFDFWMMEEGVDASVGKQCSWKNNSPHVSNILSTIESNISTIWRSHKVNYVSFYEESTVPILG